MTTPFRVWVVGGETEWRYWLMGKLLGAIAQRFAPRPLVVVHAGGTGAQVMAKVWAVYAPNAEPELQPSNGGKKPDLCLAFPGAEEHVQRARAHGVRVYEVKE